MVRSLVVDMMREVEREERQKAQVLNARVYEEIHRCRETEKNQSLSEDWKKAECSHGADANGTI